MAILSKQSYRFNTIQINQIQHHFSQTEKMIQQFLGRHTRKSRMAKGILYKKSNAGNHHTWFQIILLSHHNKNSTISALNKHTYQWIVIDNIDMRHATAVIWLWQRCWKYTMKKERYFQHTESGLHSTRTPLPCWLDFIAPKGAMQTARGEKHQSSDTVLDVCQNTALQASSH